MIYTVLIFGDQICICAIQINVCLHLWMMVLIISIAANHNNWVEPKCGHSMLSSDIFGYLHLCITSMLNWIRIWICHTGQTIAVILALLVLQCMHHKWPAMSWPLTMSLSGCLRASKRLNCYEYSTSFVFITFYLFCDKYESLQNSTVVLTLKSKLPLPLTHRARHIATHDCATNVH